MAGNLRSGKKIVEQKTLEIRVVSEIQGNEKIEESDHVAEAMKNELNPFKLPLLINQKALSENQPSICNESTEIDQKFLENDKFYVDSKRISGLKKGPGKSVILKKVGQMRKKSSIGTKKLASAEKKKIWLCEQCGKRFGSKHDLIRHLETHNPTNDFNCRICVKAFKTDQYRYQHEQRHIVSKVECQKCGKEFKNISAFRDHHRYKHSDKKTAECQICNKTLSCNRALRNHEKRVHKLK
jgi:hypothetical protein